MKKQKRPKKRQQLIPRKILWICYSEEKSRTVSKYLARNRPRLNLLW